MTIRKTCGTCDTPATCTAYSKCLDTRNFKATEPELVVGSPTKGGTKHDDGKTRPELLPVAPLLAIADVLTFGAKKYADNNWRSGFKVTRLIGACLRHLFAWAGGEDKDPESGLSHLAHAGCCILFMLEQDIKGTGEDDRYKA